MCKKAQELLAWRCEILGSHLIFFFTRGIGKRTTTTRLLITQQLMWVPATHMSSSQGKAIMFVTGFIINDEKAPLPLHGGPERPKTVGHLGCFRVGICSLLVELCERFTFFEVVCNMIPFCTRRLGCYNHQAAILNLCFIGASVLTPVFMGWLSDSKYLGRNKLVYIAVFLHFLGECPLLTVFGGGHIEE